MKVCNVDTESPTPTSGQVSPDRALAALVPDALRAECDAIRADTLAITPIVERLVARSQRVSAELEQVYDALMGALPTPIDESNGFYEMLGMVSGGTDMFDAFSELQEATRRHEIPLRAYLAATDVHAITDGDES